MLARYDYYKIFAFSAAEEPGILRRAEWIKYLALWFNVENKASAEYSQVKDAYNALKVGANVDHAA